MKKLLFTTLLFLSFFRYNAQTVDTITIKSGKPYAILINVAEYPVQIGGDETENEKTELKKNFADQNLQVLIIKNHSYIKFDNGQALDMSDFNKPYTSTAFWSGNKHEKLELYDGITNTTEFIAEKFGIEKHSSYNLKAMADKTYINEISAKNNITDNSRKTLQEFLKKYKNPLSLNEDNWYSQNLPKIKSIHINIVENGRNQPYEILEFNNLGQIISGLKIEGKGNQNPPEKFIYENSMLVQIQKSERNVTVNYDDGKMIFNENVGDADETTIYFLENGRLLSKIYTIMRDDNFSSQNQTREEIIEGKCLITKINNTITEKKCSSEKGVFPYTETAISYESAAADQGPDYMQFRKYKVEKKAGNIFEKYYSDAEKPTEKDNYTLDSTYYLDDNGLITKIINHGNTIKVDYAFYP